MVADGFLSSSTRAFGRDNWLSVAAPYITRAVREVQPVGFSYFAPGFSYGPKSTNISIFDDVDHLFEGYAPSSSRSRLMYLGFSLGADLLAGGLARTLDASPGLAERVAGILLLQPVLAVEDGHLEATIATRHAPTLLTELYEDPDGAEEIVLSSIEKVVRTSIPTSVLVWQGDTFAPYSAKSLDDLNSTGANVVPFVMPPSTADPFPQHAAVASATEALSLIEAELRSRIRIDPPENSP